MVSKVSARLEKALIITLTIPSNIEKIRHRHEKMDDGIEKSRWKTMGHQVSWRLDNAYYVFEQGEKHSLALLDVNELIKVNVISRYYLLKNTLFLGNWSSFLNKWKHETHSCTRSSVRIIMLCTIESESHTLITGSKKSESSHHVRETVRLIHKLNHN